MNIFQDHLLWRTYTRLKNLLEPSELALWKKSVGFGIGSVFLDAISLIMVLPVINILTSGQPISLHRFWGPVYHYLGFKEQPHFLLLLLSIVMLFFIIKTIIGIRITARQARVAHIIAGKTGQRHLRAYFNMPYMDHVQQETAQIITRILFIPSHMAAGLLIPMSLFISELVILVVIVMGTMLFKPLLFVLIAITLIPLMWSVYRWLRRKIHSLGEIRQEQSVESHTTLSQIFSLWQEIHLFDKFSFFEKKFLNRFGKVNHLDAELAKYISIPSRLVEITALGGITLILLFSMTLGVGDYQLTYLMSLYTVAAFRLIPSINRITQAMLKIRNYQYVLNDMEDIIRFSKQIKVPSPELSFENKFYLQIERHQFPDAEIPVIRQFNITLIKGKFTGLKGPSGSGKSTLVNMLCGFVIPDEGICKADSTLLGLDSLYQLQHQTGLVRQDTVLISGSLEENIALGEISDAVSRDRVSELVKGLGLEGMDSEGDFLGDRQVGERGNRISGGQKQRIGIARALYRLPQILILDESTNSLDKTTEKKVLDFIQQYAKLHQMAVLVISHHEQALLYCHEIFNLENHQS